MIVDIHKGMNEERKIFLSFSRTNGCNLIKTVTPILSVKKGDFNWDSVREWVEISKEEWL